MLDSRKFILKETAIVALGQAVCVAAMLGVFALFQRFDVQVLLGGLFGWALSVLNFFLMAVGAGIAADKAEKQDIKGGMQVTRISQIARYGLLFLVLAAIGFSNVGDLLAAALPLVFVRPVLSVVSFFRKSGESK